MPENEMEVKPQTFGGHLATARCKLHLSIKCPRNVMFLQLRFMEL